jgi:cytochrome c biogenesis protein CcmG, thiol:disulfide interchange protein DsbE
VGPPLPADQDPVESREPKPDIAGRWLATALSVAVVVIIVLAIGWAAARGGSPVGVLGTGEEAAVAVAVDEPAPDFELPVIGRQGSTIALSSLKGQVIVLNFWASWCLPCRDEAPGLRSAWEWSRSQGVRFVGVNEVDDEARAQAFQREFQMPYPSVFDPSASLAADYGFFGLPATYVIDAQGMMRYRFAGSVTESALIDAVSSVLRGVGRQVTSCRRRRGRGGWTIRPGDCSDPTSSYLSSSNGRLWRV